MHTIKITPNLLFEHQYTSGKFIRLANRIETFFTRIGMLYYGKGGTVTQWSVSGQRAATAGCCCCCEVT